MVRARFFVPNFEFQAVTLFSIPDIFPHSTFGLFATFIALCAGAHQSLTSSQHNDIYLVQFGIWIALIGACLANTALYGNAWWVNHLLHRQHKRNVALLKRLLAVHDEYGGLLRRCIRFVQEIEVISRGFTL